MFDLGKLVINVFNPQKGEKMLIMCDVPHMEIPTNENWEKRRLMANDWKTKLSEISEKHNFEVVEDLLLYKATGVNNGQLPKIGSLDGNEVEIEKVLSDVDICISMTEYSATAPLMEIAKSGTRLRFASMPGVQKSMEETALSADYGLVAKKCSVLTPKFTEAISASIHFNSGHKLYIDLRNRVAESDDGMCHKNKSREFPAINLPSGESCIAPYEGEDRKLGKSLTFGRIPVMISGELVVYVVENNRIIKVDGSGPEAERKKKYFAEDPARGNIAELGAGVNEEATINAESILETEKAGTHIGTGLSEQLGGKTKANDFKKPENAVHYDHPFAKGCPIEIKSLILEYPDKTKETIVLNGDYVKSLFN
ncbi:MAG: hypothetical protein KAS78_03800 [Candidatus Pacebacteria bacterium]|nr:hypothetical protein [Candidatus Paceibacterota bacterium]